ncbi:MAG TPA: N-acetylmuramoyl-L-alanine amidase [Pyrinomonadaceae bacterium]|nr:N-acetylmuramoyl-L-alanine amidase [Pyrinomonadaceae bacterium]
MSFSLIWLPKVLEDAGLKISLVDGWETRGRGDVGDIFGVICHHTGSSNPKRLNMPTLRSLRDGRKASPGLAALPGPLAQLGLARDGTYFIIAAGKAIHAGEGSFMDVSGNRRFIGIEAENDGTMGDFPWPAVQLDAYHRGVAAILKHLKKDARFCCGHKEYAPKRKPDPDLNMNQFREVVQDILNGGGPPVPVIPLEEPQAQPGQAARPTLRRPAEGDLVKVVQGKVGVPADGKFGPKTEAAVRVFQRNHGLVGDGIVGPKTWQALDTA